VEIAPVDDAPLGIARPEEFYNEVSAFEICDAEDALLGNAAGQIPCIENDTEHAL